MKDQNHETIIKMVFRLWQKIGVFHGYRFVMVLVLMILASFAEVLSIGTILPFLTALTSPEKVFYNPYAPPLLDFFNISTPSQVVLPLTVAFCAASVIAGITRIAMFRALINLSFSLGSALGSAVFQRTLYQPYAVHISRNSSEIVNAIAVKVNDLILQLIMPMMMFITSVFMALCIILILGLLIPFKLLSAFAALGLLYMLLVKWLNPHLKKNSDKIAWESTKLVRILQEGLGSIRDVLIDNSQKSLCSTFKASDATLRKAQGDNQFIVQSPRYLIETAGMVLIAVVAFFLTNNQSEMGEALPILAALALGIQRLLPVTQSIYLSWSNMHGVGSSLRDVLQLLEQPMQIQSDVVTGQPLTFYGAIQLKNVSFRYGEDSPWILRGVNLTISKGKKIGFVGVTGSGKSTLLDLVMGLLHPTEGKLLVDGVSITEENVSSWRPHIAHVPQSIFLIDGTVRENIALGLPKTDIDDEAIREAAHKAQIGETIESWTNGYETIVGERGVQLSGGQRQRIGIARALYKKADLLILDEATSALDTETEEEVMKSINRLGDELTVLIIAHRLSTLKDCDEVLEIGNGAGKITKRTNDDQSALLFEKMSL